MIKFFAHVAGSLFGAAVALLLAAWFIPGVELRVGGFIAAVVVFAAAQAIFAPLVFSFARKYAAGLLGGIGIISTLVALIVAVLIPNGLTIEGALAWVVTPLIVWFITGFGGWLLTVFVIDKWLKRKQKQ